MSKRKIIFIFVAPVVAFIIFIIVALQTTTEVHVQRRFNAPIEKVWNLWADETAIAKWWSPKDYTAPVVRHDFRVDGDFLLSMKAPDGKVSYNSGKYTEIIPQKKIVTSMSFSDENGNFVEPSHYSLPGKWLPYVTVITEFEDADGGTVVKIHESGIPLIMSFFAKLGWEQQFDKIENLNE